jgi:hypothetical protein
MESLALKRLQRKLEAEKSGKLQSGKGGTLLSAGAGASSKLGEMSMKGGDTCLGAGGDQPLMSSRAKSVKFAASSIKLPPLEQGICGCSVLVEIVLQ